MTELPEYKAWDQVPANLKTKSSLRADNLRLAAGQQPVARFLSHRGRKDNPTYYDLYDINQAIPIDTLEPHYIIASVGYWQLGRRRSRTTHRATLVGTKFDEIIGGDSDLGGSVKGLAYVQTGQLLTYWSAVHWNQAVSKASFWIVEIDWNRPEPLQIGRPDVGFYLNGHFNIIAAGPGKTTAIRLLKWWKEFRPDVERTGGFARYLGEQVGIKGREEPGPIMTSEAWGKKYYRPGESWDIEIEAVSAFQWVQPGQTDIEI